MSFDALNVAYDLVRSVQPLIRRIAARNRSLADQLERAVASPALNLSEGSELCDRSRLNHYRIAAGSTREVEAALRVAEAFGYVSLADVAEALALADRLNAMLYVLTRRPRR